MCLQMCGENIHTYLDAINLFLMNYVAHMSQISMRERGQFAWKDGKQSKTHNHTHHIKQTDTHKSTKKRHAKIH